MLFLTLFFITTFLVLLFKRDSSGILKKFAEIDIKKENKEIDDKEYIEETLKVGCIPFIFVFIFTILEAIYFIKAFSIDIYLYPTIVATMIFIIGIVKSFVKKKDNCDLTTEIGKTEYINKNTKRTFKGIVKQLLWLAYFSYMFYILVF